MGPVISRKDLDDLYGYVHPTINLHNEIDFARLAATAKALAIYSKEKGGGDLLASFEEAEGDDHKIQGMLLNSDNIFVWLVDEYKADNGID